MLLRAMSRETTGGSGTCAPAGWPGRTSTTSTSSSRSTVPSAWTAVTVCRCRRWSLHVGPTGEVRLQVGVGQAAVHGLVVHVEKASEEADRLVRLTEVQGRVVLLGQRLQPHG